VTEEARWEYCSFVGDALERAPDISDVVIWNEVNSRRFWRPQRGAAAAYAALLAQCYDGLHAVRKRLNVISSTSPQDHPGRFIAALGAAYRASGRHGRIFDSFGHNAYPNAYPNTNAESPLAVHAGGQTIDEGDYGALMRRPTNAFGGTGQPVPGTANVRIWYLEDGFETAVPSKKRSFARAIIDVLTQQVDCTPFPDSVR
jgi:hypothetical protein